jgi:hypothetical protein
VNDALTWVFMRIWDRIGSATPVRDFRMQPIGREPANVVVRHSRMTNFARRRFLDVMGERPLTEWTGRSI